jgi:hypothetical protein
MVHAVKMNFAKFIVTQVMVIMVTDIAFIVNKKFKLDKNTMFTQEQIQTLNETMSQIGSLVVSANT